MSFSVKDSLAEFGRLSPKKLHTVAKGFRMELAGAEWKMGVCLLAAVRSRAYWKLGYSTISEYGERALNLSGQKVGSLLGSARALEHLPLFSEAFRTGSICWSKVRALQSVVTKETEEAWLRYAQEHSCREVESRVRMSPSEWKRQMALKASVQGEPISDVQGVEAVLARSLSEKKPAEDEVVNESIFPTWDFPQAPEACTDDVLKPSMEDSKDEPSSSDCSPQAAAAPPEDEAPVPYIPPAEKKIHLTFELTPDEYALYERAVARIEAKEGKRLSRSRALALLAEAVLDHGTSRSRAKHQVVINTDSRTGVAWYDTERGPLPVSGEVLERALEAGRALEISGDKITEASDETKSGLASGVVERDANEDSSNEQVSSQEDDGTKPRPENVTRSNIPAAVVRAAFARAGHRCQKCGTRGGRLELHHRVALSEGGRHQIEILRVLCTPCHSLVHEDDYKSKPGWAWARNKAVEERRMTMVHGSADPLESDSQGVIRRSLLGIAHQKA